MAYSPTRRASCPSRWLSLVCKIPVLLLSLSETNTIGYYRFPLSYRDVQELLCERGIDVTHEAVRQWCLQFGQDDANRLKHRRAQPGDTWHLDEVFLTIHGERHDLWRAVAQDDTVLDILVQSRRHTHAAKREILPGVEHRQSRYLNNRCEHSHRPTRQREYRMQGFKSAGHAQRFLSAYGPIAQHFRPRRHLWSAAAYRREMKNRFESWAEITGTERAA